MTAGCRRGSLPRGEVTRHEKQGDTRYSYHDPSGVYVQVLRIPKGERVPAVTGLGS
jgi:hypothetical protein